MLNQDLEEEIQFHLDARAADLEKSGMSAQAAARQARMEFGSVVRYVEEAREEKGLKAWDRLQMDLREIFRGFSRRPAFAILAVLMLAAGIGSVVLTYSMMDGLVLQPLPYGNAERLFNVRSIVPKISAQHPDLPVNARHYLEWRKSCGTCESLALIGSEVLELTGSGKPRRLEAAISSRGILSTLGLKLKAGRDIEAADEGPRAKPVALISHELWKSLSGGDLRLLGQTILLNRVATEVVGVLPEGFHLPRGSELGDMTRAPERVDLIMPIRADLSQIPASGNFDWALIVKLREGTSLEAASGEFNAVLSSFSSDLMQGITVQLEPLKDRLTG
ncbi:MAG: ABC transporter permease, partial [Acidobacteria bacterium]|nr:ABC transporter permease [Acidobacteriota bacterium]